MAVLDYSWKKQPKTSIKHKNNQKQISTKTSTNRNLGFLKSPEPTSGLSGTSDDVSTIKLIQMCFFFSSWLCSVTVRFLYSCGQDAVVSWEHSLVRLSASEHNEGREMCAILFLCPLCNSTTKWTVKVWFKVPLPLLCCFLDNSHRYRNIEIFYILCDVYSWLWFCLLWHYLFFLPYS